MAYDSVRRQLDQLLGVDRNELHPRREPAEVLNYSDPRVCKDFLLGLCPASLPDKRIGSDKPCDKLHSDQVLERFREDDLRGLVRDKIIWQRDLAATCRSKVLDEDRRIQSIARRLKDMYGFSEPVNAIIVRDLKTLQSLGLLVGGLGNIGDGSESDDEDLLGENIDLTRIRTEASRPDPSAKTMTGILAPDHGAHGPVEPTIKILDVSSVPAPDCPSLNASRPTSSPCAAGPIFQSDYEKCDVNENVLLDSNSADMAKSVKSSSTRLKEPCPSYTSPSRLAPATDTGVLNASSDCGSEMVSNVPLVVDSLHSRGRASSFNSSEVQRKTRVLEGEWKGIGPGGLLLNREYKLRVCGQCGGLISLHDAESRLATHYSGKAHTSAVAVREKLSNLDTILRSLGPSQGQENAMTESRYTAYRGLPGDFRSKRLLAEGHGFRSFTRARVGPTVIDSDGRPGGHSPRLRHRSDHCPEHDPRGSRNSSRQPDSAIERHGEYSRDHSYQIREESRYHKRSRSRSPVASGRGNRGRLN
jgi:hypothetical protein